MKLVTINEKSYLTFILNGNSYAISTNEVPFYIKDLSNTREKCHIDGIRKLVSINGEVCSFIDLRTDHLNFKTNTPLIKIKSLKANLAIIVDQIEDISIELDDNKYSFFSLANFISKPEILTNESAI